MSKILPILIILITIPFNTNAVTVEISKSYEWDVLYFESNLSHKENKMLINYISKFNLKEVVRPVKTCDRIDYSKKTNTCLRVLKNDIGIDLTYRNLKNLKKKKITTFEPLVISDFVYKEIFKKESPFLTNFIFSGQSIKNNSLEHSIYISNIDGTRVKKIFSSHKSIVSLKLNPDRKTLAYVSYENIYPTVFLHDIYSNKRISLKKIPGMVNSLNWDKSGDNLLLSLKNNEEYYNLYKLNIKNNQFSKLTNFNFDIINPSETKNGKIIYTSIKDKSPSAYISDFSNRETFKLRISEKFLYISDIISENNRALAIAKYKKSFSLLLMDSINSGNYNVIYQNDFIESPEFMKNKQFFMLTSGSDFGNNISIVDIGGNINKEISFKNIKVTELEII